MRPKFIARTIVLAADQQLNAALSLLPNLPIDPANPLEVVIREKTKVRGMDANARMWCGVLRDLAEQGYVAGRTYSAEVWHENSKELYLPDETAPDFDPSLVKEGYRKYDFTPSGRRVLVGSTTQLTVRGFALYMQELEAFAAGLGVQLSASPNQVDMRRAA